MDSTYFPFTFRFLPSCLEGFLALFDNTSNVFQGHEHAALLAGHSLEAKVFIPTLPFLEGLISVIVYRIEYDCPTPCLVSDFNSLFKYMMHENAADAYACGLFGYSNLA